MDSLALPHPNFVLISQLLLEIYELTDDAFHDCVISHCRELTEHYDSPDQYLLFHVLIGGSPPDDCTEYDFPGEHSIESLIRRAHRATAGVSQLINNTSVTAKRADAPPPHKGKLPCAV